MERGVDPAPLARAVVLWLAIWLAAQGAAMAAALVEIAFLAPLDPAAPLAWTDSVGGETADMILALVYLGWFAVNLVTAFLVLKWIYRVNANAQLHASDMSVSPGWNVGFFFVPVLTWWKPFQGVRETWQVSHGPEHWRDMPVPGLLRWWWACWLASSMIGYVSMRLAFSADTAADTAAALWLDVASGIIGVPLAILLIRIVRRLTAAQERLLHESTFA